VYEVQVAAPDLQEVPEDLRAGAAEEDVNKFINNYFS
jgi:hypothetical protein